MHACMHAGRLAGWLAGWLADWLPAWLHGWMAGWQKCYFIVYKLNSQCIFLKNGIYASLTSSTTLLGDILIDKNDSVILISIKSSVKVRNGQYIPTFP